MVHHMIQLVINKLTCKNQFHDYHLWVNVQKAELFKSNGWGENMYNMNRFGIKIMYDYYIVMKFMFLVAKLFSHHSIVYASLTILLPWTKHK
jgi:hypothetical protein